MSRLCEGQVAIVTGAGRGLGRAYALMLAEQGARVVVNDLGTHADGSLADSAPAHEVVQAIRERGGEAIANGEDVSDWQGAKRLIDQAVQTFGGLDILINNAGILRDRMLTNMSEAEWDAVIKVHLKGTFAPCRHAAEYWRDQSKAGKPVAASIVNTVSASGLYGNLGQANYGAAKMGIASFTIITSRELARYGVTVNAIAPRAETRLTAGLRQLSEEELKSRDPRWVASLVTWLVSREARQVTGRVFEAGHGVLAVAETWRRGPSAEPCLDPAQLGAVVPGLLSRARGNVDINGQELPSG